MRIKEKSGKEENERKINERKQRKPEQCSKTGNGEGENKSRIRE